MPLPGRTTSTAQPVSFPMACAAAMVSKETRFSFASRCSATTRMMSAIRNSREPKLPHFPSIRYRLLATRYRLSFSVFVQAAAPQIRSVKAEDDGDDAGEHVVVEHGMHPA